MNSESSIDYFKNADQAVFFSDSGRTERDWYRSLEVVLDPDSPTITLEDAAAAIAGVLHLYEKPTEDLHGYTDYLPEARAFLLSREITANPDSGPDFERVYDDAPAKRDPLAALGLE